MTGFWFFDDMPRVRREKEEIQALFESVEWLKDPIWRLGKGLILDATIEVHGRSFAIQMTYPATFPAIPPTVEPQQESVRWSEHQYPSGVLCLEWGPDTWRPEVTGRQMLESAFRLLAAEAAPSGTASAVPSRHELSIGQSLRGTRARFFLSDELRRQLQLVDSAVDGQVRFSYHFQYRSHLAVIERVIVSGNDWVSEEVPPGLRHKLDSLVLYHAFVVRLPATALELESISTVDELDALLTANGKESLTARQARMGSDESLSAVIIDAAGEPHFLLRYSSDSPDLSWPAVLKPSANALGRSSPEYSVLGGKSVAVIGLGSVGSKIAESLARIGVGRFMLVDHDVFLPENVVRNGLDLHNTGELKVHAVAQRLFRLNPAVEVDFATVHLVGQESNESVASAVRRISNCDLVIDATANPRVFTLLAHIAMTQQKPLVWMDVFGGNLGGMVARSRPTKDASAFTIRDTYAAYTREHPFTEETRREDYSAISDDGHVVVASDAHVGAIAAYTVQLTIDVLLEREPSKFPSSLYLIGMERGWVFDAPMHVIALETPPPVAAQAEPPSSITDNADMVDFLSGLLGGSSSEAPTSP